MMEKIQDAKEIKELPLKPLLEVAALLQNRDISSVELTQSLLKRIASLDGRQKGYATGMADQALAAAEQADQELAEKKYRGCESRRQNTHGIGRMI